MLSVLFWSLLFYVIPVGLVIFFAISLTMYIIAARANKKVPNTFSQKQIYTRLACLIASIVLVALFITVVLGVFLVILLSIPYM